MAEEYDDLQKMMSVFGGGKTTRKKKPKKKKGKSLAQQWRDDEIEWSPEVQRELSIEFLENPPEKPLARTVSPLDVPFLFRAAEGTFGPWGITRPIISKIYQEAAKPKRISQKDPRVLEGPIGAYGQNKSMANQVGASQQRWLSHGWKDLARTEARKGWPPKETDKWTDALIEHSRDEEINKRRRGQHHYNPKQDAELREHYRAKTKHDYWDAMEVDDIDTILGPEYLGTYKTKHGDIESFNFGRDFLRDTNKGDAPIGFAAKSKEALQGYLKEKGIEKDFIIKEGRMHNSVFALPK